MKFSLFDFSFNLRHIEISTFQIGYFSAFGFELSKNSFSIEILGFCFETEYSRILKDRNYTFYFLRNVIWLKYGRYEV